jgi:serine/threonine-protein kinase
MATVHYGRSYGQLGFAQTVAIKRLHPEYARDPEFLTMFLDEARLAARVQHPNVIRTLDVVSDEGELFLVMEYVPAVSLSQLLRASQTSGERPPPGVAAAIAANVLQGLHAAHEATDEKGAPLDIVHRDVSPQNILVGPDGAARVLDFGIAKATGRAAAVTREGKVKGKFAYMAPEQITNVCVTRQSDIFAASIVLWEALTGARLFEAESETALLARVLTARIDPPSTVVRQLVPEIDAIVLRGLARDLAVRYTSARDMARDLELSVRLASASEVGEWVERLAGDELARRAARVAEIESASRSERGLTDGTLRSARSAPRGSESNDSQPAALGTLPEASVRRTHFRRNVLALLAVVLVGTAATAAAVFGDRAPPLHAATLKPFSPSAAAVGSSEIGTQIAGAEPLPPARASSAADVAASAQTAPPKRARSQERAAPQTRGSAERSFKCDPPYFVDSNGHLIYKPECFP